MRTNNIDLASYLFLKGVAPIAIQKQMGKRYLTYEFPETARRLAHGYWGDDTVPIRSFLLARALLKRLTDEEIAQGPKALLYRLDQACASLAG